MGSGMRGAKKLYCFLIGIGLTGINGSQYFCLPISGYLKCKGSPVLAQVSMSEVDSQSRLTLHLATTCSQYRECGDRPVRQY
jgi:hypothetical protein